MSPQDALGAFTEHLDRRFQDFEAAMRTKLIDSMLNEDKLLIQCVEKNRLTEWLRTALEAAQAQHNKEAQMKQQNTVSLLGGEITTSTNGKAL